VTGARNCFLLGLFLVCMCGLMLQITETRILSVIAFYHLAFFAISMAMFGMTAGALYVYFRAEQFPPEQLFRNLTWIGSAFAISVFLSALFLISTVVISVNYTALAVLLWLKLILILVPPYFFAGMAISLALTRSPFSVGLVYGVDMVGAASGCLVILALLNWIDAVSALITIAALAAVAAVCFALARRGIGDTLAPVTGLLQRPLFLVLLFGLLAGGNAAIQPYGLVLTTVHNKLETGIPAALRWNSFSRVRADQEEMGAPSLWGPSPHTPDIQVSQRHMDIDGSAGTMMYRFDGDDSKIDFLRYDITNIAYAIRNQGRAAVIGVGGGRDLLSAHLFGFRDLTGVELNPVFIDLLQHRFRDYNHLADIPGTRLFVDEARSWFAGTKDRFDLIEMSLVDTWAATGAGAFSLSENGLYTLQGWRHFLDALTPTGVFTVSRWYDPNNVTETGRLLSLAAASLRDRGVTQPQTHLFLAGSWNLATLIVSAAPFSTDELARLRARTDELGFRVLVSPDAPDATPILRQIIDADSQAMDGLSHMNHLDLTVPTDDRPFFFNQLILTDPDSIRLALKSRAGVITGNLLANITVAIIIVASFLLVVFAMVVPALPSVRQTSTRLARLGTLYFALIGFGFMFIEIGLIQRLSVFLGHPVYGLAIGLFGIILSTGLGSLISERVVLDTGPRVLTWAGLLCFYVMLMSLWFPALVYTFEGQELVVRVLISLLAIVPSGLLMGFGFPTGMRLVNAIDTRPTPWFWAVNGAAGVMAASLAVIISISYSINVSLWIGAVCYLLLGPIALGLGRVTSPASSLGRLSAMAK
jgi:spermidine synthase